MRVWGVFIARKRKKGTKKERFERCVRKVKKQKDRVRSPYAVCRKAVYGTPKKVSTPRKISTARGKGINRKRKKKRRRR